MAVLLPQAKPRATGGNLYNPLLIGLSLTFPKFIKKGCPRCKEKTWLVAFSASIIGWLLFSTHMIDIEALHQSIKDSNQDTPLAFAGK